MTTRMDTVNYTQRICTIGVNQDSAAYHVGVVTSSVSGHLETSVGLSFQMFNAYRTSNTWMNSTRYMLWESLYCLHVGVNPPGIFPHGTHRPELWLQNRWAYRRGSALCVSCFPWEHDIQTSHEDMKKVWMCWNGLAFNSRCYDVSVADSLIFSRIPIDAECSDVLHGFRSKSFDVCFTWSIEAR